MEIREADDINRSEFPDEGDDSEDYATRPCPACGAPVHELSDHCPHCGHWITSEGRKGRRSVVLVIAVIVVAVAVFLYVVLC